MAEVEAADKVGSLLTKKAGPLPIWVYGVLVLGGLGMTYYLNRNKGVTPTVTPNSGVTEATGSGTYVPKGAGAGASNPSGTTGTGPATFSDNNAWGSAAINYLVGLGNDPGQANQAITLYLSSLPLTTRQQALANAAIQKFGAPPQLLAPVNGNVPPVDGTGGGGETGPLPQVARTMSSRESDIEDSPWLLTAAPSDRSLTWAEFAGWVYGIDPTSPEAIGAGEFMKDWEGNIRPGATGLGPSRGQVVEYR